MWLSTADKGGQTVIAIFRDGTTRGTDDLPDHPTLTGYPGQGGQGGRTRSDLFTNPPR